MLLLFKYVSFFSLALAIASLWFRKTFRIWGSFFAASFLFALVSGVAEIFTAIPIAVLFILLYFWNQQKRGLKRVILFCFCILVAIPFLTHMFKWFHNWNICSHSIISKAHVPFSLWINYDKPLVGLFLLAFAVPLLSKSGWQKVWKKTIFLSLVGIFILIIIAYVGGIRWDPKIPSCFGWWTLNNLVFVAVSEEAFFRGFLQKEFNRWLGKNKKSKVIAVVLSSLIFALFHFGWVASPLFLFFVFLAGLIYGGIYQITGAIESSIFCHFLLIPKVTQKLAFGQRQSALKLPIVRLRATPPVLIQYRGSLRSSILGRFHAVEIPIFESP